MAAVGVDHIGMNVLQGFAHAPNGHKQIGQEVPASRATDVDTDSAVWPVIISFHISMAMDDMEIEIVILERLHKVGHGCSHPARVLPFR
jgi:hypothetical protein